MVVYKLNTHSVSITELWFCTLCICMSTLYIQILDLIQRQIAPSSYWRCVRAGSKLSTLVAQTNMSSTWFQSISV